MNIFTNIFHLLTLTGLWSINQLLMANVTSLSEAHTIWFWEKGSSSGNFFYRRNHTDRSPPEISFRKRMTPCTSLKKKVPKELTTNQTHLSSQSEKQNIKISINKLANTGKAMEPIHTTGTTLRMKGSITVHQCSVAMFHNG